MKNFYRDNGEKEFAVEKKSSIFSAKNVYICSV